MAINTIAAALVATLDAGLSQVDQASTGDFLPSVKTANIALIAPAFGYRTQIGYANLNADLYRNHWLPVEFWIKHTGSDSDAMDRARKVIDDALAVLLADETLSGAVDTLGTYDGETFDFVIEAEVVEAPMDTGQGVVFLLARMTVPVVEFP